MQAATAVSIRHCQAYSKHSYPYALMCNSVCFKLSLSISSVQEEFWEGWCVFTLRVLQLLQTHLSCFLAACCGQGHCCSTEPSAGHIYLQSCQRAGFAACWVPCCCWHRYVIWYSCTNSAQRSVCGLLWHLWRCINSMFKLYFMQGSSTCTELSSFRTHGTQPCLCRAQHSWQLITQRGGIN